MTDYTKLADAAVRAGVLNVFTPTEPMTNPRSFYRIGYITIGAAPETAIKDGRTVLALMKDAFYVAAHTKGLRFTNIIEQAIDLMECPDDFNVAIAEACLRALGEIE